MSQDTASDYVVTRTGRNSKPKMLEFPSGRRARLHPRGSHVWSLTAAELAVVLSTPDTAARKVTPDARAPVAPKSTKKRAKAKKGSAKAK